MVVAQKATSMEGIKGQVERSTVYFQRKLGENEATDENELIFRR